MPMAYLYAADCTVEPVYLTTVRKSTLQPTNQVCSLSFLQICHPLSLARNNLVLSSQLILLSKL